jgi:endogenous inhibitor of DNA gyrase (YacG/DUF329 family)
MVVAMARKCPTCGRDVPADNSRRGSAGSAGASPAREVRNPSTGSESELDRVRPFCSERCRLADLGKWLDGAYRIGTPVSEDDLDQGLDLDRDPEA